MERAFHYPRPARGRAQPTIRRQRPFLTALPRSTRRRSTGARSRGRESNIAGLVERSRQAAVDRPLLPLPDLLLSTMSSLRQLLQSSTLDESANRVIDGLAETLSPAVAQLWLADLTPWGSETNRAGGLEVAPLMRVRAQSGTESQRSTTRPSALIAEVATLRKPLVLYETDLYPLAVSGPELLTVPAGSPVGQDGKVGTVAAYPLLARGQFLGVLEVCTRVRLGATQLAALEELAGLAALAADRDRLLSYSRGQEALAQTVVSHAPVAIAVLTGEEKTLALSNPAFAALLGVEPEILSGRCLADLLPADRASDVAASLRLDAVYQSGEPQAMIELPIHDLERGMTYWDVTSSPLSGSSSVSRGVLVAAVEVTRQVVARQRAVESAEMAQDRIGQMMTLHATSLAVASQLGADPSELLADILHRSVALLNARAGAVYVLHPRQGELEVIVCQGLRGDYAGACIRIGEGLAGRVGETGQGMIVDDYRAYPYRTAIYDDEDFTAVIAVPLIHRGQVVGVLDVLDDAERRAFTDDDLWLLDLFAAQAAQAIENARTYVELERAYRKQRELDRMKDDFIATASHELRTPLTGVSGFLDLLLEYPGSRDEPLALEFLQKAAESAQELSDIAERLLQTSRLATGRMEMHKGPVQLSTVVDDVLRSYYGLQQSQRGGHELSARIPPWVQVEADLGRLKEVLDNLINNAMKYSPRGGSIEVFCRANGEPGPERETAPEAHDLRDSTGRIDERPTLVMPHLGGSPGEDDSPSAPAETVLAAGLERPYVTVVIRDHGIGIAPDEQQSLFRRFSRLESARASQIRGTGLGLYICRQIMRAMDGDIWLLESRPGQGSSFAFTLPIAELAEGADSGHAGVKAGA